MGLPPETKSEVLLNPMPGHFRILRSKVVETQHIIGFKGSGVPQRVTLRVEYW